MHLSRLTVAEMLPLSQTFLDMNHPGGQALSELPDVSKVLPKLREAHELLLSSQTHDELRAGLLHRECLALAAECDDLLQGIDCIFRGLALLAEDDESRARWARLHTLLIPGDRKGMSNDYAAEAENASLLFAILDGMPAIDKHLLKAQQVGKRNFFDVLLRFVTTGQELGEKDAERRAIPVAPSDASLQEARNTWAKLVGAMVASLQMSELLGELPAAVKQHVLIPLRAATERRPQRPTSPDPQTGNEGSSA